MIGEAIGQVLASTTVAALLVWATSLAARRAPAALRNAIWRMGLLIFWSVPLVCLAAGALRARAYTVRVPWSVALPPRARDLSATSAAPVLMPQSAGYYADVLSAPVASVRASDHRPVPWLALLACLWAGGAVVAGGLLLRDRRAISRLLHTSHPPTVADLPEQVAQQSAQVGLGKAPAVVESAKVGVPTVAGCFRPTLLVPVGLQPGDATLEAVLLHELAHIRRGDLVWQTVARLTRALWWWHPLAWLAAQRARGTAEEACDDWVIALGRDRKGYAEVVVRWAEMGTAAGTLACGSRGRALVQRVKRIVEGSGAPALHLSRRGRASLAAGAILLLLAAGLVRVVAVPADDAMTSEQPLAHIVLTPLPMTTAPITAEVLDQAAQVIRARLAGVGRAEVRVDGGHIVLDVPNPSQPTPPSSERGHIVLDVANSPAIRWQVLATTPGDLRCLLMPSHLVASRENGEWAHQGWAWRDSRTGATVPTPDALASGLLVFRGTDLKRKAEVQPDLGLGRDTWEVLCELGAPMAAKFRDFTATHVGRTIAFVLDYRLLMAPVIRSAIPGRFVISGDFSKTQAEDLARIVNSGPLPVFLRPEEPTRPPPTAGAMRTWTTLAEAMGPAIRVVVHARGRDGSRPVGARCIINEWLEAEFQRTRRTPPRPEVQGADADWTISHVGTGTWIIRVEADGYARMDQSTERRVRLTPAGQLGVSPSAEGARVLGSQGVTLQLELLRGGSVTGRVIDADTGKPIAGVTVGEDVISRRHDETNAGGRYTVRHVVGPGVSLAATDVDGWYRLGRSAGVEVDDGQAVTAPDISLWRGGRISGRVVLPNGAPPWVRNCGRVVPRLKGESGPAEGYIERRLNPDDTFSTAPLLPGTYTLEFNVSSGWEPQEIYRGEAADVTVEAGKVTKDVAIAVQRVMAPGATTIKVRARGTDGTRPVGGICEILLAPTTPEPALPQRPRSVYPVSGADGDWVIRGVRPTSWVIIVTASEFAWTREANSRRIAVAQPGEMAVSLALLRGGTVSGQVIAADTGRPLQRVQVWTPPWGRSVAITNGTGRYELKHVAAGDAEVLAKPFDLRPGRKYVAMRSTVAGVREGRAQEAAVIKLLAGGAVSGRVTFPPDTPAWLAGRGLGTVSARPEGKIPANAVLINGGRQQDGSFSTGAIPAGTYTLEYESLPGKTSREHWRGEVKGIRVEAGKATEGVVIQAQRVSSP